MFSHQRRRRITPIWQLSGPARGGGGGWSPLSLPGLLAWYEGNLGVSATSGFVTTWADQSSNGYTLAPKNPSPNAPQTGVNTLNSLNVLTFDSSNGKGLSSGSATSFAQGGGTTFYAFAIFRDTAYNSNDTIAGYAANGQSADWNNTQSCIFMQYNSATSLASSRNYPGGVATDTVAVPNWYQGGSIFDGTNVTLYLGNGSGLVAGTPVASTGNFGATGMLNVGCEATSGGNSLNGDIAAILVGNGLPSSTDLANLWSYWHTKWGV